MQQPHVWVYYYFHLADEETEALEVNMIKFTRLINGRARTEIRVCVFL